MNTIIEHVGQLVITRCWCGIQCAVPNNLHSNQMDQFNSGKTMLAIFCPLGHKFYPAGEPEHKRLERQLVMERQHHDQTRAELRETVRSRNAERAAKSRIRNRIGKGVCPHCNRYFQDVHRHMASKHAEAAP